MIDRDRIMAFANPATVWAEDAYEYVIMTERKQKLYEEILMTLCHARQVENPCEQAIWLIEAALESVKKQRIELKEKL